MRTINKYLIFFYCWFNFKKYLKLLIVLNLICIFHSANAENLKIGFVNTERIFRESIPAKKAQAKLEKEFKDQEEELQKLNDDWNDQIRLFEKDNPIMSEKTRFEKQRTLDNCSNKLQRKQREFEEDFNRRRNEELSLVIEKVNECIRNIAEKGNFDLIIQEAVTVSPKIDITDEVMKNLE